MRAKGFWRRVMVLLFFTLWFTTFTLVASERGGRRRARPSMSRNNVTFSVTDSAKKQLCSNVLPPSQGSSPCSTGNCKVTLPSKNTAATNSSSTTTEFSPHHNGGLAHAIEIMDDGIRLMDSQVKGGAGDSTFILGMTGAGKTTITQLLTAYSSLYSCKRSPTDIPYVIRDVAKKISIVDSLSKTKVPEIVHDPHLGTTIYDCPGFSDTNSTDELTNAYFIKHALDSSKRAKFLLVAPLHAFQTSGDRHYFGSLLLHTVKTIKNVEKYKESFALAVTFGNPTYSPTQIVKNVAGFLNAFLNEELEGKFQGHGEEVLDRAKALLESLLAEDDDGTFAAIAVFRSPTSHGQLIDLMTTQEDRKLLLRVLSATFYTATGGHDFGYSVSDAGKVRAAELGVVIDKVITEKLDQFWADIQRRYESKMHQLIDPVEQKFDIEGTFRTFQEVRQLFNMRQEGLNGATTEEPKEFVVKLMSSMTPLRLDLSSNPALSSVLLQESHLKFVGTLVGKPLQLQWTNWLKGLERILKLFEVYTSWANTLAQLEQNLGTYEIQNAGYCLPQLRDQSSGSINVTAAKIENFISTPSAPTEIYNTLKSALTPFADGDVVNFNQLNPVLEYFFTRCDTKSVKCTSDETTATLAGNFILASKFDTSTSCISAPTKQVTILASDTFFLDAPLNAKSITGNGTLSLVLIASKLKSFGHKVNLAGTDGHTPRHLTAGVGQDGIDGTDGEAGGDFFGLFGEKDGEISAELNGGKGGDGQEGGTGVRGSDGRNVSRGDLSSIRLSTYLLNTHFHNYPDSCYVNHVPRWISYNVSYPGRCQARLGIQKSFVVSFSGVPAEPGHNGGNGGKAGQGGSKGRGKVYEIGPDFTRSTSTESQCGAAGSPGQGGRGGAGGCSEGMTVCFGTEVSGLLLGLTYRCTRIEDYSVKTSCAAKGSPGSDGSFPSPFCRPSQEFKSQSYTPQIISFKSAARAQSSTPTARRKLLPFLMSLEQNRDVNRRFFTTKSITTDLVALEEQLLAHLNADTTHLPPFYESFLNRGAEMLATGNCSKQEESILREVVSVAYGRLAMFKKKTSGWSDLLITDLEGFIDRTNPSLQSSETMTKNPLSDNQFVATKEKFLAFMHSKVKEVDDLNEQVIQPEILKIQDQLHKTTVTLLWRLIEERNTSGEMRNNLQQQLADNLILSKNFASLKSTSQAVSFTGPWGAAAGVPTTASAAVQTFSSDGHIGPALASLRLEFQQKALAWYFESQKRKIEEDQLQLEDLKAKFQASGIPQLASDIVPERWPHDFQANVQNISSALNRVDDFTIRVEQLKVSPDTGNGVLESLAEAATSIKAQVRNGLGAVEQLFRTEVKADRQDEMRAKDIVIGATPKLFAILNTETELYKLHKYNEFKLSELARFQNVLQMTNATIKTDDTRMAQILYQLGQITTAAQKLSLNQSSLGAELEVSRWQLQSILDDLSSEMEIKTLLAVPIDFEVNDGLERLKEGFWTILKVCDRIQGYVTEQRMATFVSDSLLSTMEAPSEEDPELHRNLQKLKLVSWSNLVLNYWRNVENSFRMHVFPYADIYLSQFSPVEDENNLLLLPKNLTDLPTLVTEISRRTGELNKSLAALRTTTAHPSHTNQTAENFTLENPLYTWTVEEISSIISELVSGRAVNLIADVRKSPESFDAIKFNAIHLHLIHDNVTVNSMLQSALASFNLSMTHTGVNPYRFDGKYYQIYSEQLRFQVAYETGPNQYKNQNYLQLGQGPPLLSPYTLWTFRLHTDSEGATFKSLEQFVGQAISLVLTGEGTCVTHSAGRPAATQVDQFYKAIQL